MRQTHALNAEIKAIEAQQICTGLIADVALHAATESVSGSGSVAIAADLPTS